MQVNGNDGNPIGNLRAIRAITVWFDMCTKSRMVPRNVISIGTQQDTITEISQACTRIKWLINNRCTWTQYQSRLTNKWSIEKGLTLVAFDWKPNRGLPFWVMADKNYVFYSINVFFLRTLHKSSWKLLNESMRVTKIEGYELRMSRPFTDAFNSLFSVRDVRVVIKFKHVYELGSEFIVITTFLEGMYLEKYMKQCLGFIDMVPFNPL